MTLNLVKARDAVNGKKLQYAIDLNKGIFTFIPNENSPSVQQISQELIEDFQEVGDDNTF